MSAHYSKKIKIKNGINDIDIWRDHPTIAHQYSRVLFALGNECGARPMLIFNRRSIYLKQKIFIIIVVNVACRRCLCHRHHRWIFKYSFVVIISVSSGTTHNSHIRQEPQPFGRGRGCIGLSEGWNGFINKFRWISIKRMRYTFLPSRWLLISERIFPLERWKLSQSRLCLKSPSPFINQTATWGIQMPEIWKKQIHTIPPL